MVLNKRKLEEHQALVLLNELLSRLMVAGMGSPIEK